MMQVGGWGAVPGTLKLAIEPQESKKPQVARRSRATPENVRPPLTYEERKAIARDLRPVHVIADKYGCSISTVKKYQRRKQLDGWVNPQTGVAKRKKA